MFNFRCLGKMTAGHRVIVNGKEPIIRKGKLEPIELMVATRAGNKKVKNCVSILCITI